MMKIDNPSWTELFMAIVGVIALVVAIVFLSGAIFAFLFNTAFVPIFLPNLAPISWQEGVWMTLFLWLVGGAFRYRPSVKRVSE